ncbi:MAG TPA: hypothetical protein VKB60_08845, partial [Terriglobales bacterium]|nr:hypothetical protein [Terriglobales bacterium]
VQEGRLNCVTGVGKLQGRLLILIDLAQLLPAAESQSRPEAEAHLASESFSLPASLRAQAGGK